jgi:hypothetical protein
MTARAGYRCGFFVALRDPLAKMTHAPPFFLFFSCYRPVICRTASKKARKYGAICAPACIFPCSLQGAAGVTLELMEPLLGNNGLGGALFRPSTRRAAPL